MAKLITPLGVAGIPDNLRDSNDGDSGVFVTRFTQVHNAIKTLNTETFATEAFGECVMQHPLKPDVLGVMLMQRLPSPESNMTVEAKTYWLAVADKMGPDWVESFRRTAAFMAKVGGF